MFITRWEVAFFLVGLGCGWFAGMVSCIFAARTSGLI